MFTDRSNNEDALQTTIEALVQPGKGILAADESESTIRKRFEAIGVKSTEENRRHYRSLLLTTPGLGKCISGVIFFEETLRQRDEAGAMLPEICSTQGMVPGVKVDKGKLPLPGAPGEEITQGLDGLEQRLQRYKEQGARFAKWRSTHHVPSTASPSVLAIRSNAEVLARYAAICQAQGVVPIVEPEVLMDGVHSIDECGEFTENVLHAVFHALHRHRVVLEHILLKPNMVISGKSHMTPVTPEEVAAKTLQRFRRVVPAAVPGIVFLSGGQTPEQATVNLNALNAASSQPWDLSFSFGRALQEYALKAWGGDASNGTSTQAALYKRAKLNRAAREGIYEVQMESID